MTKYYYSTKQDINLINNSYAFIAYLVFGINKTNQIHNFTKLFNTEVKAINVYPNDYQNSYLNHKTRGICRQDPKDKKIIIEMLGYKQAKPQSYSFLIHEGLHEFSHAFADILPTVFAPLPQYNIINGIKHEIDMGLIKETDAKTHKFVATHYYGKLLNETMMDIISSIGVNLFYLQNTNINIIFNQDYTKWHNVTTTFSKLTSITRLAIAAFANTPNINYYQVFKSGKSIFNLSIILNDNHKYKVNDFLYGILFDPLHIENVYNKFMKKDSYRTLCHLLDEIFTEWQNNHKISQNKILIATNYLKKYLNLKLEYYTKNKIITFNNAKKIQTNFNNIYNSLKIEYNLPN